MRFVVFFTLFLVGCTPTQKPLLKLEMYGDNLSAFFVVEEDGVIVYGGGANALRGQSTWHGELDQSQLKKLRSLLYSETLQPAKTKSESCFVLSTTVDGKYSKVTVDITDESVRELFYYLEEATITHRISSILENLPKPNMDVISERQFKGSKQ